MAIKGNLDIDPRGLIFEAYRIEGITTQDCRVIFLDWAMKEAGDDIRVKLDSLLAEYEAANPDHPMNAVIREGLAQPQRRGRRGGALGRR